MYDVSQEMLDRLSVSVFDRFSKVLGVSTCDFYNNLFNIANLFSYLHSAVVFYSYMTRSACPESFYSFVLPWHFKLLFNHERALKAACTLLVIVIYVKERRGEGKITSAL